MLKKTITYKDFDDNEITSDFFFHLNKAELIELEVGGEGGSLHDELEEMTKKQDGNKIIKTMKKLILASYGEKTPDGKRFIKTQELRDGFESSNAYESLFMEMITDADAAGVFVTGIIPPDMAASAAKAIQEAAAPARPTYTVTRADLEAMTADDYKKFETDLAAGVAKLAS